VLPVVAIVGRPNVGKSTLFNALTGTRDAIVADVPGVTRDRQYGYGRTEGRTYVVIDTGGLVENPVGIETQMRIQTERAVEEADRLVLLADARAGLTAQDLFVARELHRAGKPVFLAINKAEGLDPGVAASDFHALGMGEAFAISASHDQGCDELIERVLAGLDAGSDAQTEFPDAIRVAVIGRPNVGKSTLVNRLLGDERVIASENPGTTRDSILVPFRKDERDFVLIDTAGVRRRSKVDDVVERVSVAKTLQAIEDAHVVILVLDAHDAVAEQDASVLGLALEFVQFAPKLFISARHGTGVGELVRATVRAHDAAFREMTTPHLTRALEKALEAHQPPLVRGRRIKLRYAHQGGKNPPRIIVHGNQTTSVPEAYRRYLANVFRKTFDLFATPVAVEFRTDENPYERRKRRSER